MLIYITIFLYRSGYLDKGSYLIVPSTTGCKLKKRRAQPSTNVQLVSIIIELVILNGYNEKQYSFIAYSELKHIG